MFDFIGTFNPDYALTYDNMKTGIAFYLQNAGLTSLDMGLEELIIETSNSPNFKQDGHPIFRILGETLHWYAYSKCVQFEGSATRQYDVRDSAIPLRLHKISKIALRLQRFRNKILQDSALRDFKISRFCLRFPDFR